MLAGVIFIGDSGWAYPGHGKSVKRVWGWMSLFSHGNHIGLGKMTIPRKGKKHKGSARGLAWPAEIEIKALRTRRKSARTTKGDSDQNYDNDHPRIRVG